MNDKLYADVMEILDIAKNGERELEEFRDELDDLKKQVKSLEDMESPKYIEDACEKLNEFIEAVDIELIESIQEIYLSLSDIADAYEEADKLMGEQVQ